MHHDALAEENDVRMAQDADAIGLGVSAGRPARAGDRS